MILVAGATGIVGGEICRRLVERGEQVRGLVRQTSEPARVQALRDTGVELVVGDLKDRASLDLACRGARTVVSTATITRNAQPDDSLERTEQQGGIALVDAARSAGVTQFVYISYTGGFTPQHALYRAKRGVEAHLKSSGMTYTILRPTAFMEIWLSPMFGFDPANASARVLGSGERPISWISLGDVAAFAVASIDNPAAANQTIELGGPDAMTWHDVIRTFEKATGRPFTVEHVPEEALQQQWDAAQEPMQKSFAGMMLALSQGDAIDMRGTLERFPIPLTSIRDFAARFGRA
jgi:uncharacterized protein YbjT (DUF2867 family)